MLYNAISPSARSPCNYYSYRDECESLISASMSTLQGKAIPRFCLSLFSWSIMYLHTRLILYLFEK
ncbi:hypothetical protein E2C01_069011 [Portunus trituberculatus]|uniref:Uncharacterized protein n=1 Tax=Portunus trituberculatus TaxID=210409 RepID=A0A5B7HXH1_PORTR|nr:hypothetical protein [Portunus trituberculatus]